MHHKVYEPRLASSTRTDLPIQETTLVAKMTTRMSSASSIAKKLNLR
jgi:hypothetical protein